MKRSIIITALTFLFGCVIFSSSVLAETKAEKILGEHTSCLQLLNIKNTKILDDQTILFETASGEVYINRLSASCAGLRSADAFSYATSLDRLCGVDIITVVENGSIQGASCGLDDFIKIKDLKNIRAAVKLLIDEGALKDLIKEGAFKKAFPADKAK